jgi:hypothetical protein
VYGGYNPMLVGQDLLTLLTNNEWNYSQLSNPELLLFLADPLTSPDPYNGGVPDGAAAVATNGLGNFDPSQFSQFSQFSTDLSTLLASLGTTAGTDALSAALAEISAQISADLATFVPQSVLSMF